MEEIKIAFHRCAPKNNKAKTHCCKGHEFNSENTIVYGNRRICRPCRDASAKARIRSKSGERVTIPGTYIRTHCQYGHEFTPENTYTSKKQRFCRTCKEIREAKITKEMRNGYAKAWRDKNPEKVKQIMRRENLRQFGLSVEDYDEMLIRQGGVCAICKLTCTSGRRLAVDHCHSTGVVRGLLCGKCNQGIGHFDDEPVLLMAAASYLMPKLEVPHYG